MLPCFGAFFYVAARCFSPCLIFWRFWIKPKARKKESKRIFFRSILREVSRTFDWASPARSGFTTFCHQKVVPKVSAGHLRRDRTAVLTERVQKTALFCTPAPGARTAVRSDSSSGAMRKCCALRATMILISFYSVLAGLRPAGSHCKNNLILTSGSIPHLRLGVSCKERIYHLLSPKGGAKSVRRAPPSGSDGGAH